VGQIETTKGVILRPFACHSEAKPKNLRGCSGQAPPKNLVVMVARSEILRGVYTERSECAQDDDSRLAVKLTHYPPDRSLDI